jgi:hypothetical protein
MAGPRDWRPAEDDEPPAREFKRRGHMWSWDDSPSSMPKAEQRIRYAMWAGLVIMFVLLSIKVIVG